MVKGKCQYCGTEIGNVKMHEKFCKMNPSADHPTHTESPTEPSEPTDPNEPVAFMPIPNKVRLGLGKIQVNLESADVSIGDLIGGAVSIVKDLHTLENTKLPKSPEKEKEVEAKTEIDKLHQALKPETPTPESTPQPA